MGDERFEESGAGDFDLGGLVVAPRRRRLHQHLRAVNRQSALSLGSKCTLPPWDAGWLEVAKAGGCSTSRLDL